jgi:hypothetical protein
MQVTAVFDLSPQLGTVGDRRTGRTVPVPAALERGQGTGRAARDGRINPQILAHIEAITGREGGRRRPTTRTCPTCRAVILQGLDDDVMAAVARVDPWPTTPLGEIVAHLSGRHAYSMIRGELHRRDTAHIGDTRWPVLPGHLCGQPLPRAPATRPASHLLPADPPF